MHIAEARLVYLSIHMFYFHLNKWILVKLCILMYTFKLDCVPQTVKSRYNRPVGLMKLYLL